MAESKSGSANSGGAGFFAKRVQKQFSRAQEKVLQKLGKTMETKDEQFEQCSQNLNKQQTDGNRLFKDIKAYYNAVKAMHETSKRLSQTLKDVYEPDWNGKDDLALIVDSEDLLWNDYEEKLVDQTLRTMESYTSQFPDVKERVAKRGRKLVDYDSARHHLEALQNTKKKDEAKITKAEEEFNKAQSVFEDINAELREELPVLYQSRIGCYVTVFQNVSNLRDVFYKEMSKLNNELYNVMKKLETQHSDKKFVIKGLHSTASKNRRSLVISAPIPCNTAFPSDHSANQSLTQDEKQASPASPASPSNPVEQPEEVEEGDQSRTLMEEQSTEDAESAQSSPVSATATEDPGDSGVNGHGNQHEDEQELKEEVEDSSDEDGVQMPQSEEDKPEGSELTVAQPEQRAQLSVQEEDVSAETAEVNSEEQSPLGSLSPNSTNTEAALASKRQAELETSPHAAGDHELVPDAQSHCSLQAMPSAPTEPDRKEEETEESDAPRAHSEGADDSEGDFPPGFRYKALALEHHISEEAGELQFQKGDIILILEDAEEKPEGTLRGVKESDWLQHEGRLEQCGIFTESLIKRIGSE